jgi:hypothetical protein
MHEFELNNNTYKFPEKWEELTPDQFLTLVELFQKYKAGEVDYFEMKVLFVMKILGIKPRRIRSAEKRQLRDENLYRMSEKIDFFLQIIYENQQKFKNFSPKIKKQLRKKLPEDIDSKNAELRLAKKMNKWYDLDAVFFKNLLPEIKMGRRIYKGYTIDITEGIAVTSLTAIQFADALTVSNSILEGKNNLLPLLIGILYQGENYSDTLARERAEIFKSLPKTTKQAVFLNFIAVREYLLRHTKYWILFDTEERKDANSRVSKKKDKYSNGLVDSIDSLVKLGYGTSSEMENKTLFRFLDTIIKSMRDSIQAALKEKDATKAKVAKKLGISVKIINELE